MRLEGILPVNKPAGWTSHDVVAKMRGILQTRKIGHTGTLDPQVTGVLPLCIGRATRVVEYMQERRKAYRAVIRFGMATDTQDMSGQLIHEQKAELSVQQIETALQSFNGLQWQVPPMFSAVKVNGQKLYELARAGKTVERAAREIMIYDIRLLEHDLNQAYPQITIETECSKGTYIRTLCVDIGDKLKVPAVMLQLERIRSGSISLDQCYTIDAVEKAAAEKTLEELLLPVDHGVMHLPKAVFCESVNRIARYGHSIALADTIISTQAELSVYRCYLESGEFFGLYVFQPEEQAFKPKKLFI